MANGPTPRQREALEDIGAFRVFQWLFFREGSEAPKPGVHVMGVTDDQGEWYKVTFPRSLLNPMMAADMDSNTPDWWVRSRAMLEERFRAMEEE